MSKKTIKRMSFAQFMNYALYDPHQGYYTCELPKIGVQGDFITAPELTPLYGYTLAQQCHEVLSQVDEATLLEFGAGTGALCVAILTHLERLKSLPERYLILEVSASLQKRQKEFIAQKIPHLFERVSWLKEWPNTPFNGVIIANEVLDAMPVHRFMHTEEGLLESYISSDDQQQFHEQFMPCENQQLLTYITERLPALSPPYVSEVNLFIDGWISENFRVLKQGLVLIIDYGFPRHEYYHPDRNQGTLMCHYQHQAQPNPLLHVGQQDITAHVDFTHVAEAGHAAGFHVAGYTNQASFLLANGLLHLLEQIEDERELVQAKQACKQLIQAHEMGELFKVLALTKNIDFPLTGFLLNDKRVSL